MTEFTLEDTPLEPVALTLERRVTAGTAKQAPDKQSDRVSLGTPRCRPLTADALDPDGRVFLAQNPGSSYWLLDLLCSFRMVNEAPITHAWLEVALTPLPDGTSDPTAWSMEPLTLSDPVKISQVVTLDGSLKLTSPVVPLDIGVARTGTTTTEIEKKVPYVEAYREGTPRPSWWFTRTVVTEVSGVHRLRTVVELPAGAGARAVVSAGATVKLKRLGVFSYRTGLDDLPDDLSLQFGLTG
jgi:hypothetical protein